MELEGEKHYSQSSGEERSKSSEKTRGTGHLQKTWSGGSLDAVRRLVFEHGRSGWAKLKVWKR